jgi:hypothetical protein
VTGFSGVIESPNFPSQYPDGLDCTWNITAPRGNKINATFSHFELEDYYWLWRPHHMTQNCSHDYVEVWFFWACECILAIQKLFEVQRKVYVDPLSMLRKLAVGIPYFFILYI